MSMMTATYPLAGAKSERAHTAAPERRVWGFWATLGWFGVACVSFLAASVVAGLAYGIWWGLTKRGVALDINAPMIELLATVMSMPAAALALVLASRKRGWTVREYLALKMPRMRHVAYGAAALVGFFALASVAGYFFPSMDQSEHMLGVYRAVMAEGPWSLVLLWIILVVSAPVAEEIIFRGFLMRGWSATRLGAIGALVLTSVIFASIHTQYNLPGMAVVCGLGLMFGAARLWSGSTVLSIGMHAAWNLTMGILLALSV